MAVRLDDIPPPLPPRPITIHLKQQPRDEDYSIIDTDRDADTNTKPPLSTTTTTTTTPILIPNQISSTFPRPSTILPKPIVIPQTAHTYHGSIHRPFTRATSPALLTLPHPISTPDFLTFLDALNTVWLANPYIQAAGQAGNLLSFVPTIEFQLIALGIQTAAEYGSFVVSQVRTRQYLRLANERLFAPRGLRVRVLKTREMLRVVGVEGEVLELPAVWEGKGGVDEDGDEVWEGEGEKKDGGKGGGGGGGGFDPRMRRMEALKDHVSPLVVEERRAPADGDNWLRRAAGMQEKWFAERQNNRLIGRRGKAVRGFGEAEAADKELLVKMDEVEWAMDEARGRAKERMQGPLGDSLQGRGIVQDDLDKELKKLDRQMEKLVKEREKRVTKRIQQSERRLHRVEKREARIAQKVRWVVITGDDGTSF
ncbi:hypothetical protein BO78DRAFT_362528 [Aspergillus sclerotiicarbonarius CBS 121057]|uniref:Uncharacterized protein n=1 Tax=Aspergillus sclerotiicarbonarius (strain CBS 121057 / IBT 28362) TaxID=1448318 RepID=A0A319F2I4_ASPSB|nr:hypothetical protein BO78DRAFT_362528 [Aspergillus sclerotiicarbonarius CBS 121057]